MAVSAEDNSTAQPDAALLLIPTVKHIKPFFCMTQITFLEESYMYK